MTQDSLSGLLLLGFLLTAGSSWGVDPLAVWTPNFDPSSAQNTYILSNVDHPAIEGAAVGSRIRDRAWERSGGRLFVDVRPPRGLWSEQTQHFSA